MVRNSQRGQTLPVVLVIMTLLFLLAGGVTMAISAVLKQQTPNRAATASDLAGQNVAAAMAAGVAGGTSGCGAPAGPAPTEPLFSPDFAQYTVGQPPPRADWTVAPTGAWRIVRDQGQNVLEGVAADPRTPALATAAGMPANAANYSVRADLRQNQSGSSELDARVGAGASDAYLLLLQDNTPVAFDRRSNGRLAQIPFPPGVTVPRYRLSTWWTLEIDVVGEWITAKVNGVVLQTARDPTLPGGPIGITTDSSVDVRNVVVTPVVPLPQVATVTPNPPLRSGPQDFYCQRVDDVRAGRPGSGVQGISQRREVPSQVPSCQARQLPGVTITITHGGPDVKVWLTVAWPAAQPLPPPTVDLVLSTNTPCPARFGDSRNADCSSNQQSASPSSARPAATLIAADCANTNPSQTSTGYSVFLVTPASAPLAPVNVRWAPEGNDSVYMTAALTGDVGRSPFEEADIRWVTGGGTAIPTALTYEGPLG